MQGYFLERLRETSTWKGIIFLLTVFGFNIAPEYQEPIISVGLGLAGLLSVSTGDKLTKDEENTEVSSDDQES